VVACDWHFLFLNAEQYSIVSMYNSFIPLCLQTLGCSHLLVILNNAVMNMGTQIFLQDSASNSFGYISISRIAGLHGNSI
jgi:hypothetical protein